MNNLARAELIRELEHMQRHGTPMAMLGITVRKTQYLLIAGRDDGMFSLDYPREGWSDIIRACRFTLFCRKRGFRLRKERWRNVPVVRASIGSVPVDVAQTIAECFLTVFQVSGPFGLSLQRLDCPPGAA